MLPITSADVLLGRLVLSANGLRSWASMSRRRLGHSAELGVGCDGTLRLGIGIFAEELWRESCTEPASMRNLACIAVPVGVVFATGCLDAPTFGLMPSGEQTGGPAEGTSLAAVQPGGADAGLDPADASADAAPGCSEACALAAGTCVDRTCVFSCTTDRPCDKPRCPAGLSCAIQCIGKQACRGDVECKSGESCSVTCNGEQACTANVLAEAPRTEIRCGGYQGCFAKVRCEGGGCDIACELGSCRLDEVRCCGSPCTFNGVPRTCG
jgi:hypothetical protein